MFCFLSFTVFDLRKDAQLNERYFRSEEKTDNGRVSAIDISDLEDSKRSVIVLVGPQGNVYKARVVPWVNGVKPAEPAILLDSGILETLEEGPVFDVGGFELAAYATIDLGMVNAETFVHPRLICPRIWVGDRDNYVKSPRFQSLICTGGCTMVNKPAGKFFCALKKLDVDSMTNDELLGAIWWTSLHQDLDRRVEARATCVSYQLVVCPAGEESARSTRYRMLVATGEKNSADQKQHFAEGTF